jgi:hypothetical protein
MEPKGFMGYPKRGSACELSNYGYEHYPSDNQNKIIEPMVFANYPKHGITFLLSFGMAMQYPSTFQ